MIEIKDLHKSYQIGHNSLQVLKGIDFVAKEGEMVAIMGSSGSGKSTFMNLLGCLDTPTQGKLFIEDIEVSSLTPNQLAEIRNKKIG